MNHIFAKIRRPFLFRDLSFITHPHTLSTFCFSFMYFTLLALGISRHSSRSLMRGISLISRSLQLLPCCSGLSRHPFVEFISQHIKPCQKLSTRILTDSSHPIQEHLAFVFPVTRSNYKHRARTRVCKYSTLPDLTKFLKTLGTVTCPYKEEMYSYPVVPSTLFSFFCSRPESVF